MNTRSGQALPISKHGSWLSIVALEHHLFVFAGCADHRKLDLTSAAVVTSRPPPTALITGATFSLGTGNGYMVIYVCGGLWNVSGFQAEEGSANMFYTCGPNEAMVVSGKDVNISTVALHFCSCGKRFPKVCANNLMFGHI